MSQTSQDRPLGEAESPVAPHNVRKPRRGTWVVASVVLAIAAVGAGAMVVYVLSDARGLRDEVATLTADNDALRGEIETISGELDTIQGELAGARAVVVSCQEAVESARELSLLFEELSVIDELWWETEEGSVEEAELDAAGLEVETAMLQTLGQFETQADACMPSGAAG